LKAIRAKWKQAMLEDYAEFLGRKVDAISQLKREAYAAWERSKEESTVEVKKEKGIGDPRFLEQIRKCEELECRIMGALDGDRSKPQVNINVDAHGAPIQVTEEQRWRAIRAICDQAGWTGEMPIEVQELRKIEGPSSEEQ
jgi:hypothetical protein